MPRWTHGLPGKDGDDPPTLYDYPAQLLGRFQTRPNSHPRGARVLSSRREAGFL